MLGASCCAECSDKVQAKMNGGRSDASTSTDDVKSRPLCLFYFTHPFGVLSPEPPTLAAAPPHIARAFVNMEPVSPFTLWSPVHPSSGTEPSEDDYNTASSASRPSYELGNATVHRTPLNLVSVTRTRKCTLDFGNSRDSISSSLFSSDVWFNSSSSCKSNEFPRRLIPYKKILPPLQLPSPKDSTNLSSSDDFWPKKCLIPEKFSLPPIKMPSVKVKIVRNKKCSVSSEELSSVECGAPRAVRSRRRLGVSKLRRARPAELRRLLASLMRRALTVVHRCCSLPLRSAVLAGGVVGLAWAALYLFLFSAVGARLVGGVAGDGEVPAALRYVHGALGVLLCALHALLLLGAARESDALCDVYVWGMLPCWAAALAAAVALAAAAALAGSLLAGTAVLFVVLLSVFVSSYFVVVVVNYRLTMP